MNKIVAGHRWYSTKIPKGEDVTRREHGQPKELIISVDHSYMKDGDVCLTRNYAWFRHLSAFLTTRDKMHEEKAKGKVWYGDQYYEVIRGADPQKAKFDIDITRAVCSSAHDLLPFVIEDLVKNILRVAAEWGVELSLERDIIVTDSSRLIESISYDPDIQFPLGDKASAHVIVDNVYLNNNKESLIFYQQVVSGMKVEHRYPPDVIIDNNTQCYIDDAVYSSSQDFRLLHSSKIGKQNTKMFKFVWRYFDRYIIHDINYGNVNSWDMLSYLLSKTLVGSVGTGRYITRYYVIPEHLKPSETNSSFKKSVGSSYEPIDIDIAKGAYKLFTTKFPNMIGVFLRSHVKDNMIYLKRRKPSYCPKCERHHDNNNSFITVHEESYKCYLGCYASNDKPAIYLGSLADEEKGEGVRVSREKEIMVKLDQSLSTPIRLLALKPLTPPKTFKVRTIDNFPL